MKKIVLISLFLFMSPIVAPLCAQDGMIKIDLKTAFEEKLELRHIKSGIEHSLKSCPTFRCGEVGEDYSFWITAVERSLLKDGRVRLSVSLELRTPAMITHGKLLKQSTVTVQYTPGGKKEMALLSKGQMSVAPLTQVLVSVLGKDVMSLAATTSLGLGPIAAVATNVIEGYVSKALNRLGSYSNGEQLEGLLIGPKCVSELKRMIAEE